jgi:ubiquinone biosynthesis protein
MWLFGPIIRRFKALRRYNQILRVFVKYGFEDLVSYLEEEKRFGFIRKMIPKGVIKSAKKYSQYERMRLLCEELGPTFVKFGQILSNRPDLLPAGLITELETLQDNVPALPGKIARQTVESELGASVDDLFAWFEPESFASASMAQVHKVTLKTGERAALKIQRPGISELIYEDVKVMYKIADILERRVPSIKHFDPIGLVRNFEDSIKKELDFIHESVNLQRFNANVQNDKEDLGMTRAPKVYKGFTTSRVLAMEFISGIKISEIERLKEAGHDPKRIARKLAVTYFKQVFEYGFFHADPHPGNLLVVPSGNICFLDFGMMGSILPKDIELLGKLFIAIKDKEIRTIIRVLQDLSGNAPVSDMHALETSIHEFIQNYAISGLHENEMSTVLLEIKDIVVEHGLKVPGHFFLLGRSMVTIEGVIEKLDPDLDLIELAKPFMIRVIQKKFNPFTLGKKVINSLVEFVNYMEDFPRDLKNAVRKINSGQVKVDLTHRGIDPMVHTFHRIAKQLISAILIAALVIGSTLLIINKIEPFYKDISLFGIIGFSLAGLLCLGMFRDLLKGDKDDWQGWNKK